MAYEGQIAGAGRQRARRAALENLAIRAIKRLSTARGGASAARRWSPRCGEVGELEFVNGGGTGSISSTAAEAAVTEIAAGLGLLRADAVPVLPIAAPGSGRRLRAAGGAQAVAGDRHRARRRLHRLGRHAGRTASRCPVLPAGLRLDAREGAGEAQTPLLGPARRRAAGRATGSTCATPRPASCASASTRCT